MTTPTSQPDQIQKLSVELSLILNYETHLERTTQLTQLLTLVLLQYRIRMCFAVLVLGVTPYIVWILQMAQLTLPKQLWSS